MARPPAAGAPTSSAGQPWPDLNAHQEEHPPPASGGWQWGRFAGLYRPRQGAQGRALFQDPKKYVLFRRLGSPQWGDPSPSPGRGLAHPTVAAPASRPVPPTRHSAGLSVSAASRGSASSFLPVHQHRSPQQGLDSRVRADACGRVGTGADGAVTKKGCAGHKCGLPRPSSLCGMRPNSGEGKATFRVQGGQRPLVVPFPSKGSLCGGDSQLSIHPLQEPGAQSSDEVWAPLCQPTVPWFCLTFSVVKHNELRRGCETKVQPNDRK